MAKTQKTRTILGDGYGAKKGKSAPTNASPRKKKKGSFKTVISSSPSD